MKHIHFAIYTEEYYYYLLLLFFLDRFLPLSVLIIPNPHGMFKLEGRNMIFQDCGCNVRSLILKEKISD
jgi:hypothetical protein